MAYTDSTASNINLDELINGDLDTMCIDARDLAASLREVAKDDDEQEKEAHLTASKAFLADLGINVNTLDEAIYEIEQFTKTGSPTLVQFGYEEEFGEDEWHQLGLDQSAGAHASLIERAMDYEKLGTIILTEQRRTKSAYGETVLWVEHQ